MGFTCSIKFNGTSLINIISTTTEADSEEFVDDVDSNYPVNSVYSNNGDIVCNDEKSVSEDSNNESVRSKH